MDFRRIAGKITGGACFVMIAVTIAACDSSQGIMHGGTNMPAGMGNWNWAQIFICLGIGFLAGFLFNRIVSKGRR
jgi:hypothetical protein